MISGLFFALPPPLGGGSPFLATNFLLGHFVSVSFSVRASTSSVMMGSRAVRVVVVVVILVGTD